MAYEVLARKWRPGQFDEVVGQDHVVQTLRNAIKSGRIAHAYVFVGPRGIGKTSIARILAKALNCVEGPTDRPCDKCSSCLEIAAGTSLDVIEIDGASNRGIDEMRDLRQAAKFAPAGRHKIYIIDEVHGLTGPAFEALLKTLEEPPAHVKFFFATTEPHKVPLTILSRCQRFDLRRIAAPLIVQRLEKIAQTEKVKAGPGALEAIARAAEGGLRDAESALDQLIAFRGAEIDEESVLSVFGLVSRRAIEELAGALLKGDVAAAVACVEGLDRNGKDMRRLVVELLDHFRNLLVFLHVGRNSTALDMSEDALPVLEAQAALTDVEKVLRITDILADNVDRLQFALSPKTLLETALIRCARAATVVSLDEILKALADWRDAAEDTVPRPVLARDAPAPCRPAEASNTAKVASVAAHPAAPPADPLALLRERWRSIAERVGHVSTLGRNALLDAKPVEVRPDSVVIGLDPEFAGHMQSLAAPRNRALIQKILSDTLHKQVSVEFKMLDAPSAGALPADHPVSERSGARANDDRRPAIAPLHVRQKWMDDKTVRRTAEVFRAQITDVRE